MANLYSDDLYGSPTYSAGTTGTVAGDGTYNEIQYNQNLYNAAVLVLALFETITSTDAQTKSDSLLKIELITIIDVLQKIFNGAIFSETITSSDVRLMKPAKVLLDIMTITDTRVISLLRALPETITLSDLRTLVQNKPLSDFIVLVDVLTKQITDKRLPMDNIRLNDWLEIRNSPQSDPWN